MLLQNVKCLHPANYQSRKQWVSLKIITADNTEECKELRNLRSISEYSQENLASRYIVQLLDEFLHQGPNGSHQCLVFELLGPTVNAVLEDLYLSKDELEPESIMKISQQLLQTIDFIHGIGYAHGGMMIYGFFIIHLHL
jgi:serine/threonine-protein kinase SRPK3